MGEATSQSSKGFSFLVIICYPGRRFARLGLYIILPFQGFRYRLARFDKVYPERSRMGSPQERPTLHFFLHGQTILRVCRVK